jgi:tRNA G37 N-methylase Trm5
LSWQLWKAKFLNSSSTPLFSAKNSFPPETLTQVLQDKLPADLRAKVPQAFDIIGDIVVIDIPPQLKVYQNTIGEAILQTQKNVKPSLPKQATSAASFASETTTSSLGNTKPKPSTVNSAANTTLI